MKVVFAKSKVCVYRQGKLIAVGKRLNKLYELEFRVKFQKYAGICGFEENMDIWHRRMGHLNANDMIKLINGNMVDGIREIKNKKLNFCEPCLRGKQTRKPFLQTMENRSSRPLQLVHSDVCGPLNPESWSKEKYFVSFIDDYTHFVVIYVIKNKSEVFDMFQKYAAMSTAHFGGGTKMSKLRVDNGGEYSSEKFKEYCSQLGVQIEYTVPHTPELNGVAERLNRTIIEKARTMICDAKLDKKFWNEAVLTSAYLLNRSPTRALKGDHDCCTPAELWYGKKPNLSKIKTFGCVAYVHIPKQCRRKLDEKSARNIMMGYAINGYRLWNPIQGRIITARDVVFKEDMFKEDIQCTVDNRETEYEDSGEGNDSENDDPSNEELGNESNDVEENDGELKTDVEVRRGSRVRRQPEWVQEYDMSSSLSFALNAESYVANDPKTLEEAKARSDWPQWQNAIYEELASLKKNNAWKLTELPSDRRAIQCKWVFKIKTNENGGIGKYKARLVAKGFSQKIGFDYNETYAPVAKLSTLRVLLAVANQEELLIHQMDVKTAFLNGNLKEEIFMNQPEGYSDGGLVCRLNKALYGLKQASRIWNERFHDFIVRLGFRRTNSDSCLYETSSHETKFFLLLYVDDLILISNSVNEINLVKEKLSNEFEMTNMNELKYFLGFNVERDKKNGIMKLSQKHYLLNVLRKFSMEECKPISTPMEVNLNLKRDSAQRTTKPYRELIGCLNYVAMTTRPDLAASVGYFSRFQNCATDEHFMYLKRILKYIKGTIDVELVYARTPNVKVLQGFADADWAGDSHDRKSTSGFVFKVFDSTVSWTSRKQITVSLSSTEAEYVALSQAACEAVWLRLSLTELGYRNFDPTTIYEDNQSCIKIAEEPRDHKRMKHIDVKHNFIREVIGDGKIVVKYIPSSLQVADIMTKSLNCKQFIVLRRELGLLD